MVRSLDWRKGQPVSAGLRAFVVEDEPPARQFLQTLLARTPDIEVAGVAGECEEAITRINALRPDLVFLDVKLRRGDGFAVLRGLTCSPHVIFTTAYEAHAVTAFELGAIDYLLKPFTSERLARALERLRRLKENPTHAKHYESVSVLDRATQVGGTLPLTRLFVRDAGGITPIPVGSVQRLEADGDYVRIFVDGKSYLCALTLNAVEAMLDPAHFVRVHRSHLVNFEYVTTLKPYDNSRLQVVLRDGTRIVASRTRSRDLRQLAF